MKFSDLLFTDHRVYIMFGISRASQIRIILKHRIFGNFTIYFTVLLINLLVRIFCLLSLCFVANKLQYNV